MFSDTLKRDLQTSKLEKSLAIYLELKFVEVVILLLTAVASSVITKQVLVYFLFVLYI